MTAVDDACDVGYPSLPSLRDVPVGVGLTMMLVGEGDACRSSHRRGGFRGNGITCHAVLMQASLP